MLQDDLMMHLKTTGLSVNPNWAQALKIQLRVWVALSASHSRGRTTFAANRHVAWVFRDFLTMRYINSLLLTYLLTYQKCICGLRIKTNNDDND